MTGVLDGFDNCLAVVIHAPQLDAISHARWHQEAT